MKDWGEKASGPKQSFYQEDFRKSTLDNRFNSDANFNQLVRVLHNMIATHGFTPSELREAAFLAHYKYEMENSDEIFKQNF